MGREADDPTVIHRQQMDKGGIRNVGQAKDTIKWLDGALFRGALYGTLHEIGEWQKGCPCTCHSCTQLRQYYEEVVNG